MSSKKQSDKKRGQARMSLEQEEGQKAVDGSLGVEENKWEVEEVLDKYEKERRIFYFVKWKNRDSSFNTWELSSNLNCDNIIRKFENQKKRERLLLDLKAKVTDMWKDFQKRKLMRQQAEKQTEYQRKICSQSHGETEGSSGSVLTPVAGTDGSKWWGNVGEEGNYHEEWVKVCPGFQHRKKTDNELKRKNENPFVVVQKPPKKSKQNVSENCSATALVGGAESQDEGNGPGAMFLGDVQFGPVGFARKLPMEKIVGATLYKGEIGYIVKWVGEKEKDLVPAWQIAEYCPRTLIDYLESQITWD